MKLEHAKVIVEAVTYHSSKEAKVNETYSGRGMYGGTTAAVILPSVELAVECLADAIEAEPRRMAEWVTALKVLANCRRDYMGKDDIVIY